MLTVIHEENHANAHAPVGVGGSLLDELVRDGARAMLAAALQAEVAAYVEAHADQVDQDGHRLVVRNGHHQAREVSTAAGAVPVRAPRVNDKRIDEASGSRVLRGSQICVRFTTHSCVVGERRDHGPASDLQRLLGSEQCRPAGRHQRAGRRSGRRRPLRQPGRTGPTTSTPRSTRRSGPGTAGEVRHPVREASASTSSRRVHVRRPPDPPYAVRERCVVERRHEQR